MRKLFAMICISFCWSQSQALTYGFVDVDSSYVVQKDSEITVTNMPAVRSQDTIGICYAFTAAAAIDAANCKSVGADCANLPAKKKVSTFDLAKYSSNVDKGKSFSSSLSYSGIAEGGDPLYVIQNSMFQVGSATNEECVPFDQIVAKPGDPAAAQKLQKEAWERLKQTFDTYKKKYGGCQTCAADFASSATDGIKQDFNLQQSNQDILKAFSANTYSDFLEQLLIPDACRKARQLIGFESEQNLQVFPKEGKSNYASDIAKVKEVLGKQNPVIVDGYCADEVKPPTLKACKEGHSFLISGYRKVCNAQNQCRDLVKVHNSWGQAWQDAHNGGWLDAKEILDRTFYGPQSLGWLEAKYN